MSFADLRRWMVDNHLRRRGIVDPRVLQAMLQTPRESFVPESLCDQAYTDRPLPIGFGQTISQPWTVAFMAQALKLTGSEKVLEIGTGSGYGAAVLSCLARSVFTVERIPALANQAGQVLEYLGYPNVHVRIADGTLGLAQHAPFDAIVVTAGAVELPQPYSDQLSEGGRIVIPIGPRGHQNLYRVTKRGQRFTTENLGAFAFVPLIGHYGRR